VFFRIQLNILGFIFLQEKFNLMALTNSNTTTKLILLWAFSESALGGMLHALRIPLTGLFVGGSAVIFISLIAYYSKNKASIIHATILVLIVKFVVSPHTPLPAYFSVFAEGLLGFFLFNILKLKKSAPILLGIFSLLFSSLQKILVFTVLFGMTLWESIDVFIEFVLKQLSLNNMFDISFSYLIISTYISIHILGGMIAGITAGRIPNWVDNFSQNIDYNRIVPVENLEKDTKSKRKLWYQKGSGIIFITITLILIVLSYTTSAFEANLPLKIIMMFVRSFVITALWFVLIAPIAMKFLQKLLNKKKSDYTTEIENLIKLLPEMKSAVKYCWLESNKRKGFSRLKLFLSYVFVITLREE